ncbi:sensor histidine kinase [Eisenbergiella sp.]
MDKFRNKRILSLTAAAVLTVGCLLLFVSLALNLAKRERALLGIMSVMAPEWAGEFLEEVNRGDFYEQAGRELENRYGYHVFNRSASLQVAIYFFLFCSFSGAAGILCFLTLKSSDARRRRLEEEFQELQQKKREQEEKNWLVTQRLQLEEGKTKALITDISHQLKNPLASLKMSYELADTESLTPEEQQSFVKQGFAEILKIENLLDTFLQLSRLEAHMICIQPEDSSLKDTIIQAVNRVYMKAFQKEISIELNDFTDFVLPHDPKWTQEALINLLDNAIKYSPSGSHIEIRVIPVVSYIFIEVEDEGIGIPASEYSHIFQRFYRGSSPQVRQEEGSGVGLYLTRKILEEQGGTIRVKKGQKGSVFQLTLPKRRVTVSE